LLRFSIYLNKLTLPTWKFWISFRTKIANRRRAIVNNFHIVLLNRKEIFNFFLIFIEKSWCVWICHQLFWLLW
jgi:hypothetical protein